MAFAYDGWPSVGCEEWWPAAPPVVKEELLLPPPPPSHRRWLNGDGVESSIALSSRTTGWVRADMLRRWRTEPTSVRAVAELKEEEEPRSLPPPLPHSGPTRDEEGVE